jgi:hypothetical protein
LPAVGLGDVLPPRRLRPVGAPLYASMQIREVGLEICLVLMPGEAVDARCRPALQLVKRKAQQVDVHMVQERRQPDPFITALRRNVCGPLPGTRLPSSASGACCSGPHCPRPRPFPPPPPRPRTRPCSAASRVLWASPTSPGRASRRSAATGTAQNADLLWHLFAPRASATGPFLAVFRLSRLPFFNVTKPRPFW